MLLQPTCVRIFYTMDCSSTLVNFMAKPAHSNTFRRSARHIMHNRTVMCSNTHHYCSVCLNSNDAYSGSYTHIHTVRQKWLSLDLNKQMLKKLY